jgi:hypothetical protein
VPSFQANVPDVCLDNRSITAINPVSGEHLIVAARDGDVAVLLEGEWIKVFHFFEDRVNFKAVDLNDADNAVARAACALAAILSAKIVGDEGEQYR